MKGLVCGTTQGSSEGGLDPRRVTPRASPLGPRVRARRWADPTCPGGGPWPARWPRLYKGLPRTLLQPVVTRVHALCLPPALLPQFILNQPGLMDTPYIPSHITPTPTGLTAQGVPGPSGHWDGVGVQPGFPTSLGPHAVSRKGSPEH